MRQLNLRSRQWLLLTTVVAFAMLLGACSSSGDTTTTTGDSGATTTTAGEGESTTTTIAPEEPSSLIVAPPFPPLSLDPHGETSLDLATRTVAKAIFDTLVVRDGAEFIPALATSWSNPTPTEWEFVIRDGVLFHDGTTLTGDDVVASLERVIAEDGPLAGSFGTVESVTADGQTVTVTTATPDGTLLGNLTLLFIGPAAMMDEAGFWDSPVGTGPFVPQTFTPGENVQLVANTDYWQGAPALDNLEFRYLPDEFGRATALETGEADVTYRMSDDTLQRLMEDPDLVVETVPSYGSWVIWVNASSDATSDKLVRQAMWHAVDWQQIIDDLFPLTGSLATSAVSPSVFGYSEMTPYDYDPDRARELLAEAGYPDGISTTAMFREGQRLLSLAAISYWAEVGIDVEPLEKVHATWLEDLLALNWDVNFMVQNAGTGDAAVLLGRLYPCAAERTGYCNPDLDALLLLAGEATDPDERLAAYNAAIEIIWEDVPGIFPIDVLEGYVWRDTVTGFVPDPSAVPGWYTVDNSGR